MSYSPERISSYRRHFEDSSSSYHLRVASPSPTRRHRSASATATRLCGQSTGRRTLSSTGSPRVASMSALCLSIGGRSAFDLDAAAVENQEYLSTRTSERQEMVVLNDRLAAYIEKVRTLEQDNKLVEAEIEELQKRYVKPSGLRGLYEEQLRELRRIAEQMTAQRDLAVAAKTAMMSQLEMLKTKYEEAAEARKKAELEIEAFRPDVDAATSARIALEKQLENLEVEIEFLKRVHQEEIEELMQQIFNSVAKVEMAFALPDLAAALKQIQSHYDDIAAKNLQDMDAWYKSKFEDLNNASTKHVENVRNIRNEISSLKKAIQNKERELAALHLKNEALQLKMREAQERHKKELEELQEKIKNLELELKSTKEKIALHLREYQDLLNVKMALEIEIITYRKLIEGEDTRLTDTVRGMSLLSNMSRNITSGMVTGSGAGALGHISAVESYSKQQAVETTERKTVLIRTVKTEDDTLQSNTQEQTIIITGAADDTDED